MDLPVIWASIIAFAVLAYVMLDGLDLGVGILFAVEKQKTDRDTIMNSIAPVWDGNETWLILGGGGLFAVFPLAYATILPALYPAIICMLLALVFRGVAFEFRFRAQSDLTRGVWDISFMLGSALAGFCQGLTLGGLLQGIKVVNRVYAGGWWDWLTPFTVLCGIAVVVGYALLGATWLIWRTEETLQERCRGYAQRLGITTIVLIGVVSLWTPMLHPRFAERWFSWPGFALTLPFPILVALLSWIGWKALKNPKSHIRPLVCSLGLFILCFAGLGTSMFPLMVPPDITIWDASAPPESQLFLLFGASVLVPVIWIYSGYNYWVFRGKVKTGENYH